MMDKRSRKIQAFNDMQAVLESVEASNDLALEKIRAIYADYKKDTTVVASPSN